MMSDDERSLMELLNEVKCFGASLTEPSPDKKEEFENYQERISTVHEVCWDVENILIPAAIRGASTEKRHLKRLAIISFLLARAGFLDWDGQ